MTEPVVSGPLPVRCPSCAAEVSPHEAYCEACGTALSPTQAPPAEPWAAEAAPITLSRSVHASDAQVQHRVRSCRECGARVDADGYCEQCGAKAPSERDHFEEAPSSWVGGVCDRGVRHHRNEDAMALASEPVPGSRAILVVCDGVSTSEDSDVASLAAARAAREVLLHQQPMGMAVPQSRIEAIGVALQEAAVAANAAVVDNTSPASENSASCTLAAAVVQGDLIVCANVGDSRSYWLPDHDEPVRLSVDDSVAEMHVQAGVAREVAENGPQAHAITKWLGKDAPEVIAATTWAQATTGGWLLVCSDGLWNYASEPSRLHGLIADLVSADPGGAEPVRLADRLVRWACEQGGRDNVTVALARFGPPAAYAGDNRPDQGDHHG